MEKFNKRRLIISGILFVLVIVLLVFINTDVVTFSKYERTIASNNDLNTALYLLDDKYQTITVKIPDVIPSNNQYLYTFSVSNFKDDLHSDTNLKYKIRVRTTTNLRIGYDLFNTLDIENAPTAIATNNISPDDDGTYFRNLITNEKTMLYSEDKTDYYTLLLTFPVDYKDSMYSGVPELIEINVESKQVLDSDD